jgi:hypothetical protein
VFSGEARVRSEHNSAVNFGIDGSPKSDSIAFRTLLGADVRTIGGARLFVQSSYAQEQGRSPFARSFDESDPDIAQAFIELPLRVGHARMTLRAGRQEFTIANRLVSLRDGVTLRRTFDGARLDIAVGGHRLSGFYLIPIINQSKAFDDRRAHGETFAGVNWQLPGATATNGWTIFAFDRKRRDARFASISGVEHRQTIGVAFKRTSSRADIAAQGAVQFGSIVGQPIRAFGGSVDAGWSNGFMHPTRVGFQMGYASGDHNLSNKTLGTFDPLYPNLGAFGDAPVSYYANQVNTQVNIRHVHGPVTLQAEATLLARATSRDAIYLSPGRPIATPKSGSALTAVTFEASVRWRMTPRLEFYASALRAEPLDGIRAVGGGRTNFALIQLTTGF